LDVPKDPRKKKERRDSPSGGFSTGKIEHYLQQFQVTATSTNPTFTLWLFNVAMENE